MASLGRILFALHLVFLLLAGIFFFSSFAGFTGSGYVITSTIVVILLWGTFGGLTVNAIILSYGVAQETGDASQALQWTKWLFGTVTALSALTGLGLAFLSFVGCGPVWLPSLYHWTGMIGTILGFVAFFLVLPLVVRACMDENNEYAAFSAWGWIVFVPLGVVVLWGLAWLIPFLILKDSVNVSEYLAKDHVYKLPFLKGESSWVIQGNNTSLDHQASDLGQKFAWDFRRPCGTPVLAARNGTIARVVDTNSDFGSNATNNQIQVNHADGTAAFYLHIEKGSIPARFRTIGAAVKQGQQIANAGCVGISLTGHIHFEVRQSAASVPTSVPTIGVSFTDVTDDNGIPRTFSSYTSGNVQVP
jgi:hypothetical protein